MIRRVKKKIHSENHLAEKKKNKNFFKIKLTC